MQGVVWLCVEGTELHSDISLPIRQMTCKNSTRSQLFHTVATSPRSVWLAMIKADNSLMPGISCITESLLTRVCMSVSLRTACRWHCRSGQNSPLVSLDRTRCWSNRTNPCSAQNSLLLETETIVYQHSFVLIAVILVAVHFPVLKMNSTNQNEPIDATGHFIWSE